MRGDLAIAQRVTADRDAAGVDLKLFAGEANDGLEGNAVSTRRPKQNNVAAGRLGPPEKRVLSEGQPETVSRVIDQHDIAIVECGHV